MKKVLAALDNSPAGRSVLATARALAALLDAEVEALHVRVDGDRTARTEAKAAGIRLRTTRGPVVERLVAAGDAGDVVVLSIGARGMSAGRRPLGATAAAVAAELLKPVVIVPPDADPPPALRRVLVPLEGSVETSFAPRRIVRLARDAEVEVIALHIHDADSIPAFTDQPQHEQAAWAREFIRRYCPWGVGAVRLETRIGRTGELVPLVADERDCDLIALAWSQQLSHGRAPVVRETLERSHRPVLLFPVQDVPELDEALVGATSPGRSAGSEVPWHGREREYV